MHLWNTFIIKKTKQLRCLTKWMSSEISNSDGNLLNLQKAHHFTQTNLSLALSVHKAALRLFRAFLHAMEGKSLCFCASAEIYWWMVSVISKLSAAYFNNLKNAVLPFWIFELDDGVGVGVGEFYALTLQGEHFWKWHHAQANW